MSQTSEFHCECRGHLFVKTGEDGIYQVKCPKCGEEFPAFDEVDLIIRIITKCEIPIDVLAQRLGFQLVVSDWIEPILEKENQYHQAFFGQTFDLEPMKKVLEKYGQKKILEWSKLGLEVHYLPFYSFSKETKLPGWKVKPMDWYWNKKKEGEILVLNQRGQLVSDQMTRLDGIIGLIDTRFKPKYRDGKQMWVNDKNFLGSIIKKLREEGKIAKYKYGLQSSRFGVSAEEWEKHIKPALAEFLGVKTFQVRLERAIEANIIPQLYPHMPRCKDGETDTWVWYEEFFENASIRLIGGNSLYGGLAAVDWQFVNDHWDRQAFRPLVVLDFLNP